MTKHRGNRANRKRHKTAKITLPGGQSIPQPPTQGARNDLDRDPMGVVLEARARQAGISRDEARNQMLGCAVGRMLITGRTNDRDELWEAVQHMRKVMLAYDRAIGSPKRHAQCLRIMTPPERFEADAASPAPDMRTEEERDKAAASAWVTLKGWLSFTDYAAREACKRAVVDEPDQPITDWPGVILALRCVADGMKGRNVVVRERK